MQILNRAELRDRLFGIRGATMVSFVARTDQSKTLKGGKKNPLYGLIKVAYVNGTINWNYAAAVNRQREREADDVEEVAEFHAEPRSWGKRLHDVMATKSGKNRLLPLVAHIPGQDMPENVTLEELQAIPVENLYLEFKPGNSIEYHYFHNGKEISADEAHAQMRDKNEGQRQEVENVVRVRDYKLVSIEQITIMGESYHLA